MKKEETKEILTKIESAFNDYIEHKRSLHNVREFIKNLLQSEEPEEYIDDAPLELKTVKKVKVSFKQEDEYNWICNKCSRLCKTRDYKEERQPPDVICNAIKSYQCWQPINKQEECEHEWISVENKVVTGGYMCIKCYEEGRGLVLKESERG